METELAARITGVSSMILVLFQSEFILVVYDDKIQLFFNNLILFVKTFHVFVFFVNSVIVVIR